MRTSRVLLAGVAVAAAAAGTSAFTNSNSFTAVDNNVAGYGAMTASGVAVSNIQYVTGTDISKLHSVVFTVDKDTTGMTDVMTLTSGGATTTPVTGSASTCAPGGSGPTYTITCTLTVDLAINTFDNTSLTVTSN
jgi:hypothetical protein